MISTMSKVIYLDAPNMGVLEKDYLAKAIDSGYISTIGPFVAEFEDIFTKYLASEGSVTTQSGTAALHVALYELGLKDGDEVILPALTFAATANPVMYTGARPVFVDVDARTWNLEPEQIRKNITGKTKAIIPVHLYGNPCNMQEIMHIAEEYNLHVIEDATESLGAKYMGRYTGTFGTFGCFSFNGNKVITTGGGGMVVGNDKKKLEHIKFLTTQARDEAQGYYHPEIGFNYRMTNLEAALGLAQMERLETFLAKKKKFSSIYKEYLSDIEFVRFQEEYEGAESCWWITSIMFDKEIDVPALQTKLSERGIPNRKLFMPITEFPPYKAYKKAELNNSYHIYKRGLCLPSSTRNSEEDIYDVCKVIKDLLLQ